MGVPIAPGLYFIVMLSGFISFHFTMIVVVIYFCSINVLLSVCTRFEFGRS